MKPSRWIIGALGGIGLAAFGLWAAQPPRPPKYNVLLIVVDTLRADHLGAWGYERNTSPHIDALAADGIRFANGTSQAPWTAPSIASLMTSRYPLSLGITRDDTILPGAATTLAEVLQQAGFATGAVVSHSYCGADWGFAQGFDSFDESNVLGHMGVSSPGVTDAAIRYLDAHQQEPFFLWLHYFDPHYAYQLHDEHDFLAGSTYAGPVQPATPIADLTALTDKLDEPDIDQLHRLYDAEVAFTDVAIGRVLAHLDSLGLRERTLVVFTADHGEAFADHGLLGHGKNVYEELVHVPIVVDCPDWAPATVTTPVANVDLFPTVLACLDQRIPSGLAGRILGPTTDAVVPVFSHTAKAGGWWSIRLGDDKLIARGRGKRRTFERFDLSTDPGELRVLQARAGDDLAATLTQWERSLSTGALTPEHIDVDAWLRENLAALGYTEDD